MRYKTSRRAIELVGGPLAGSDRRGSRLHPDTIADASWMQTLPDPIGSRVACSLLIAACAASNLYAVGSARDSDREGSRCASAAKVRAGTSLSTALPSVDRLLWTSCEFFLAVVNYGKLSYIFFSGGFNSSHSCRQRARLFPGDHF